MFREEEGIMQKSTKINMTEVNISQKFRLKEIDEKINYFIEEINYNGLICKKYKKFYKILY